MHLNDLLKSQDIDPSKVIVMRHRPHERQLAKVLPWLAAERPETFNAYQQTQGERVEGAMKGLRGQGHVASFIGHAPGKALFVGLYKIGDSKPLTRQQFWSVPGCAELLKFGMLGFTDNDPRETIEWFDLTQTEFYEGWKGKLVVNWPPPERSWWRRAHRNEMAVLSVFEESAFDGAMPEWDQIDLGWEELAVLPSRWKAAMRQWRGIYFIFDESDRKGYVGSAYGTENLLGRWLDYAASGHGGNRLLRERLHKNFRFTVLQRVSPDMNSEDVIRLEASWKDRLHTRAPFGLNDN